MHELELEIDRLLLTRRDTVISLWWVFSRYVVDKTGRGKDFKEAEFLSTIH